LFTEKRIRPKVEQSPRQLLDTLGNQMRLCRRLSDAGRPTKP
jgi:hypothetical protein